MTGLGPKIIQSLKEAIAGDLQRVTIEGITWVRKAELDRLQAELATWKRAHIELGEMYDRLQAELSAVSQSYKLLVDTEIRLRAENASLKAELDWHVEEIKRIKAGE